jgi:hypothetical protein
MLVVAQGLLVFSAAAYTLKFDNQVFFYSVIGFGIVFTLLLLWQQRNYLGDFETHLKQAVILEEALGKESIRGSWSVYEVRHKYLRDGKAMFRLWVESGPYIFFIFCFLILAILKMIGLLCGFDA